ncbi:hypothetical protein ELQ92_00845 [Labedella populi]|uniref:Uncharacterized protein n=1 Tax=Labedella populi TaxID=2498850 RepID=A0A3S3ZW13_9MICO|nr:hypothetical protein [Labedella populi]RWZ67853.1 hypothetical protein ELQ92_00845 [Labedella populi]
MLIASAVADGPTFVEVLTAWSTLAAALATAISVIFIAVQIAYTRKSVESTSTALKIARDEFTHGQHLRHDSHRAAIDAEMPRITVEVTVQSDTIWRPDRTTPSRARDREIAETVSVGSEFTVPRDDAVPLRVGFALTITNDGPRRAAMTLNVEDGSRRVVLAPGEHSVEWAYRTQPLSEWIAIAEAREQGRPGEERTIATLSYSYPGDVGADGRHQVLQGGTIVERVRGNAGGRRVIELMDTSSSGSGALFAAAQPFERVVYRAFRREGRRLEPPATRQDND